MKNIPSDLKLLTEIYERYYEDFKNFSREEPTRDCKVYVPIKIRVIASHLNTDEYITFGRLYNHLSKKYEFKDCNGASSPLFKFEGHEIHFPLLASILAGMQEENERQSKTINRSTWAVIFAWLSILIAGFNAWTESNKKTVQYNLNLETVERLQHKDLKQK